MEVITWDGGDHGIAVDFCLDHETWSLRFGRVDSDSETTAEIGPFSVEISPLSRTGKWKRSRDKRCSYRATVEVRAQVKVRVGVPSRQ